MKNKFLYERGFYITNDDKICIPFADKDFWNTAHISGAYKAYIHKDNRIYTYSVGKKTVFLIGHAYNPVKMIFNEERILELLLRQNNVNKFFSQINELTGIFLIGIISDGKAAIVGDPSCIQCASYGMYKGKVHIASHTHMLEDVCNVEVDPYIYHLTKYRFYHLFGKTMPGDITPYKEFKRLIPNHYVIFEGRSVQIKRFFPVLTYEEYNAEKSEKAIKDISHLMNNNLALIVKKWERPAISMTGGCDSKTTLSCCKNLYDKFLYFSYLSSEEEKVDAEAAHKICNALGLSHKVYEIPMFDSEIKNIENVAKTIRINTGDIGKSNANDIRKRAYFAEIDDFDIEVKSWVSECGRAYYNKRFLKKHFPKKPTAQYLTSLYKVFVNDRKLVRETNQIFSEYLEKYLNSDKCNYPWQELFFWEFRVASWNGLVITGEHKYSFDITIPYNNRLIIDKLLRFPLKDRIEDNAYRRIREYMNPDIDKLGICVNNVKHTKNRAKLERLYLEVMSRIPF